MRMRLLSCLLTSMLASTQAQSDNPQLLPIETQRAYATVAREIKNGFIEPVDDKQLLNACLSGMAAQLDPDSAYLDAEAFKNIRLSSEAAIGLVLDNMNGLPVVISAIEGSPAHRANIQTGDTLIKIDGQSTKGMSTLQVTQRLRGKPGTPVTITIKSHDHNQPSTISLVREEINRQASVSGRLVANRLAYLRITQFTSDTAIDFARTLKSLIKQGSGQLDGLIIDLRNNPGGLLDSAIVLSALFLPERALVATTMGRDPEANRQYHAALEEHVRKAGDLKELKLLAATLRATPLTVLVNQGTAAGSEIFLGAMQDHKRATIIGSTTYGRSSIQTILPLSEQTALKLTTARWLTPAGRSAHPHGLDPDVSIEQERGGTGEDNVLSFALKRLESAKGGH